MAIKIHQIKKSFSTVCALNNLSLHIRKGEFFGLLGPNGAGKSTLINIMAGLTKPDQGAVEIEGFDVAKDYRMSRRHLGVVPQELVFDPFFTVREVLLIQAGYFGLGKENHPWIDYLIESLTLADKAHTNMRALSGGMKRRVLIAQALVHKPSVVILDEPTAGVDVELRASLWSFIKKLHSEGLTIVLTTHYLEEAESLCDRIAILNHGHLIALEEKEALLARNSGGSKRLHIFTAAPVTSLPAVLNQYLIRLDRRELIFDLKDDPSNFYFIIEQLKNIGAIIDAINSEHTGLEDIFLQITQSAKQ